MKKVTINLTSVTFILLLVSQIFSQIPFAHHTIAGGELSIEGVNSVYAIDIDGDTDIDVLSASYDDDKITWFENDGNQK